MNSNQGSRAPNLFIVGAPKCGTSAMQEYLRAHPDIFMCSPKEPHYFGRDLHRINHKPRTKEQYLELFASAGEEKWVGDASTSYLYSATAALEIREASPDTRIIIMLRNPVDVMHASYAENLSGGFEFIGDFVSALDAEPERKKGRLLPRHRPGLRESLCYREVVQFDRHIERYLKVFGRERVHVVMQEEFQRDSAGVYRETLQFLGVDSRFQPGFRSVNVSHRPRSVALNNFIWNPPQALQKAVRAMVPSGMRKSTGQMLKRANIMQQPRAPLAGEIRRRLTIECTPGVERLSELLGRDLTAWCAN